VRRLALDVIDQTAQRGLQAVPIADDPHPDIVADQTFKIGCNKPSQQPEDKADFLFRAAPVFRRETEHRQVTHAMGDAKFDQPAQRLDALDMAFRPRLAAGLGPASVAVHDDADVTRNLQVQPLDGLMTDGGFAGH
jgi:hypothetical protein